MTKKKIWSACTWGGIRVKFKSKESSQGEVRSPRVDLCSGTSVCLPLASTHKDKKSWKECQGEEHDMSKQLLYIQNKDATWRVYMGSGESFPRLWKQGNQDKKMIVLYILFVGCSHSVQWWKCSSTNHPLERRTALFEMLNIDILILYVCLDCTAALSTIPNHFLYLLYYLYFVTV